MRIFQYYQTNNNLLNIVIWKYFFNRFRHKNTKNLRTAQGCKMSSPAKGGSQPCGWQIASSRDLFCDFGRKLENLSVSVDTQWCSATDGRTRLHEPRMARWTPVTSLRENLTQTHLDFSYFRTTEPKLTPALRKMPLTDLRHTIGTGDLFHKQTNIW